jgi:hypothetical protein
MKALRHSNLVHWKMILPAFLFSSLAIGLSHRGEAATRPALASRVAARFAIADFDGDHRPDLVVVQPDQIGASRTFYWIRFEMSAGLRQYIGVKAPVGGLAIAPRDVNGDKILDLIVTTAWLNQPVAVLLNDGHGNFTLSSAASFPGIREYDSSFDHQGSQAKDGVALSSSRSSSDCDQHQVTASARRASSLPLANIARVTPFFAPLSTLARAPPFVRHV